MKIAVLPGDGIGTEIVAQALRVLAALELTVETEHALVGGAAYEACGHPLPDATLALAKAADAVLFGAEERVAEAIRRREQVHHLCRRRAILLLSRDDDRLSALKTSARILNIND